MLHIYLLTNKTLIHNSLYVFDKWGKNLSHKKMSYNYSRTMFTRRAKPIRIVGNPDKWSSTLCVCLCLCVCVNVYIHTHTHTQTHTYGIRLTVHTSKCSKHPSYATLTITTLTCSPTSLGYKQDLRFTF
jgi:hypothetical protein